MRAMGFCLSKKELMDILAEIDEDSELAEFCQLCTKFLVEDPDIDTMKRELRDRRQGGARRMKNSNNFLIMFRSCKLFSNLSFFMIYTLTCTFHN